MGIKANMKEYIPLWSFLRTLRTNRLVSSTYIWLIIVPVAAKATAGLNEYLSFETGGTTHSIALTLPFSWQIFFLSALMFVIGNILFIVFSPKFIKLYSDFGYFTRLGGRMDHLEAHKDEAMKGSENQNKRLRELAGIKQNEKSEPERSKDLFWALHENYNDKCIVKRFLVSLAYLLGFLLFSWVALSNIYWALKEIFF
ncbi:hypothetical protein [Thioalkalivibrio halophilus]|uniref:hypothetical protein n=1 Tax=Thioalkalivibrio halophilus TaxID=252474 RepID=UPI00117EA2F9|nr:hypothetical protein [Thioalkalivibrio halophilus]